MTDAAAPYAQGRFMKHGLSFSTVGLCLPLLAATAGMADGMPASALIPQPERLERRPGRFHLAADTAILADSPSLQTARQLAARLRPATGYPLAVDRKFFSGAAAPNTILLTTQSADTNLAPEGYALSVSTNSIVIRAPTQAGLFYGAQTLAQLLPPEIFSTHRAARPDWVAPCVEIQDRPRFKWRGLMLDVSRHFYTKSEVERMLDMMALYKLNRFHWHLTDDDGWRIEIKKYPLLTQIGAWRDHAVLTRNRNPSNAQPAWVASEADKFGANGRYGGFYTQKEIREVVGYATARHIVIVPEIEMPGHSGAALAAYPELTCSGKPYVIDGLPFHVGVYCAGNDQTFTFLQNVLTEVFHLFPGQYIHIGGDEVEKTYWQHCGKCQARMKQAHLKTPEQLQSWFVKRVETFVNARGKTLIGWSEIIEGGLATNAVVMDWIGGGKEAAGQGHDAVMSPMDHCYFDHYQSRNRTVEPLAIGDFLPLDQVYSFEPIPAGLPAEWQSHVLGGQANLWTEYIGSMPHAEYMLFPRLGALAEALWSPKEARDWANFERRLVLDEKRLDALGVNYRRNPSGILSVRGASVTAGIWRTWHG